MSKEMENNCVILYKKQSELSGYSNIKSEDFLLGIMTNCQIELLKNFGKRGIICMDSTHGTNPYNFNLITILVVDDFGEGFPVAFLFSNREDYAVLKLFISAVKQKSGDIAAHIFMSNDAEQYFAAWSALMDVTNTNKLLCIWHVDRAWRNKISMIKKKTLQEQVYKTLCILRQEPDIEVFNNYLKSFNNMLDDNSELKEFKIYFNTYYANRCISWAQCYRAGSIINTNMYLESMHKILKYIYLRGVQSKRLDKTIGSLMKFIKDKQFDRVIKLSKGKVTHKISLINRRHMIALNSTEMKINSVNSDIYTVQSSNEVYTITKNALEEGHKCKLVCQLCNVCIHLYSCSCPDYIAHVTICKHIHFVNFNIKKNTENISNAQQEEEEDGEEQKLHVEILKSDKVDTLTKQCRIDAKLESLKLKVLLETRNDVLDKVANILCAAEKLLDSSSGSSFSKIIEKDTAPANKKIDQQIRFYSTKKKIKSSSKRLGKPTPEEKDFLVGNLPHL